MFAFHPAPKPTALPLFGMRVPAGAPSPTVDFAEGTLDLNEHLIRRPASTFFMRVVGDSMIGVGLHDGALVIIDRSLEPKPGHVVVAVINSEFRFKILARRDGGTYLEPTDPKHGPIILNVDDETQVWGVVTTAINRMKGA